MHDREGVREIVIRIVQVVAAHGIDKVSHLLHVDVELRKQIELVERQDDQRGEVLRSAALEIIKKNKPMKLIIYHHQL